MTFIAYVASFLICLNSLYIIMDYYQYAAMTANALVQHTKKNYEHAGLEECTPLFFNKARKSNA
ncbi:hypothetical protein H0W26_01405 [Candidatus Dependentiae bacterium]|nr:hypothetical protein [Candidatus Dependentiae bacterium]